MIKDIYRMDEKDDMCVSTVRSVCVLDRQNAPLVFELYGEDKGALQMQTILYASLDRLDEIIMAHGVQDDQDGSAGYRGGLYLGRLASVGMYSIYGFLTSVHKRVLLCLKEDQSKEKVGDGTINDVMMDIADAYADHVANPFVENTGFSSKVAGIIGKHLGVQIEE